MRGLTDRTRSGWHRAKTTGLGQAFQTSFSAYPGQVIPYQAFGHGEIIFMFATSCHARPLAFAAARHPSGE